MLCRADNLGLVGGLNIMSKGEEEMTNDTVNLTTPMKRRRRLRVAYNLSQTEPDRKVAAIRISGQYLESLGFKVGGFLDMEINDDRSITLRPVTDEKLKEEALRKKKKDSE